MNEIRMTWQLFHLAHVKMGCQHKGLIKDEVISSSKPITTTYEKEFKRTNMLCTNTKFIFKNPKESHATQCLNFAKIE